MKDTNITETFRDRINGLLVDNCMKQSQLAKELGITPQAIYKYTKGKALPTVEMLSDLAHIFNVSTDYLLGKSDLKKECTDKAENVKTDDSPLPVQPPKEFTEPTTEVKYSELMQLYSELKDIKKLAEILPSIQQEVRDIKNHLWDVEDYIYLNPNMLMNVEDITLYNLDKIRYKYQQSINTFFRMGVHNLLRPLFSSGNVKFYSISESPLQRGTYIFRFNLFKTKGYETNEEFRFLGDYEPKLNLGQYISPLKYFEELFNEYCSEISFALSFKNVNGLSIPIVKSEVLYHDLCLGGTIQSGEFINFEIPLSMNAQMDIFIFLHSHAEEFRKETEKLIKRQSYNSAEFTTNPMETREVERLTEETIRLEINGMNFLKTLAKAEVRNISVNTKKDVDDK